MACDLTTYQILDTLLEKIKSLEERISKLESKIMKLMVVFCAFTLVNTAWAGNGFLGIEDGTEVSQSVEGVPVAWYPVLGIDGDSRNGLGVQVSPARGLFDSGTQVPLRDFRCPKGQKETVVFASYGPRFVVCSLTDKESK